MGDGYTEFLATKTTRSAPVGIEIADDAIHPSLFPFQRALVRWAAARGRAAMFCNTGLGKTRVDEVPGFRGRGGVDRTTLPQHDFQYLA